MNGFLIKSRYCFFLWSVWFRRLSRVNSLCRSSDVIFTVTVFHKVPTLSSLSLFFTGQRSHNTQTAEKILRTQPCCVFVVTVVCVCVCDYVLYITFYDKLHLYNLFIVRVYNDISRLFFMMCLNIAWFLSWSMPSTIPIWNWTVQRYNQPRFITSSN